MSGTSKEWFSEWFNSPYYHILYKDRDFNEAERFITNLANFFPFHPKQSALDVGCGRGRHSVFLNNMKLVVDGIDLSPRSIEFAKSFENTELKFYVHDMRETFRQDKYDYVFNMFTSFGYFEDQREDIKSIQAFTEALKNGGSLVLDFLNPIRIIKGLVPEEVKLIDGVEFHITREFQDGFILKNIVFHHNGISHSYQEKVKALSEKLFLEYFDVAGLKLMNVFGDYSLKSFDENVSERMIFVAKKTK